MLTHRATYFFLFFVVIAIVMASTSHTRLVKGMTRDLKLHRFPQAIVKINAEVNLKEMTRRSVMHESEKARALFKLPNLGGDMADAHLLLADGDVAYVLRNEVDTIVTNGVQRSFMNMNNRIKVNTAINGLSEDSPWAIEALIEPVGWIEQGNEDGRLGQTNLIRGGSFTILYNGIKTARQNAWLRVRVPTPEEAAKMKTDKASHLENGVVTLMYEEYNPMKTTYLRAEKLYRILNLGGEAGTHAFGQQATTEAENFIKTLAVIRVIASGHDVDDPSYEGLIQYTVAVIKDLIKRAVEKPDKTTATFISNMNMFIQHTANFRLNEERMVVCKTQHAASNGLYVSVDAARYSY